MKTIASPANFSNTSAVFNQVSFQRKTDKTDASGAPVAGKTSKKILLSLAALGTVALAGVAIYKCKNKTPLKPDAVKPLNPPFESSSNKVIDEMIKTSRENIGDVCVKEGVLKEHQEGFFAAIQRAFDEDYEKQLQALKDEYNKFCADGATIENSSLARLNGCDKYLKTSCDGTVYPKMKEAFPKEKAYIKSVLKRIKDMIKTETDYLKKQTPLKKDHDFYRAFTAKELETSEGITSFPEILKSSNFSDNFTLDACPASAVSDLGVVLDSVKKDSDGTRKIIRILTGKGDHLPYSKTGETIFPANSEFKFIGSEKIGDVEIYELQYRPFEMVNSLLGRLGLFI